MSDSFEILKNRLTDALKPYGAKSEFCRKVGVDRSLLEKWLAGETAPNVNSLDKIAAGLGIHPWELIRPDTHAPQQAVQPKELHALVGKLLQMDKPSADHFIALFLKILSGPNHVQAHPKAGDPVKKVT